MKNYPKSPLLIFAIIVLILSCSKNDTIVTPLPSVAKDIYICGTESSNNGSAAKYWKMELLLKFQIKILLLMLLPSP
jgi:predicted transcriptional regulator